MHFGQETDHPLWECSLSQLVRVAPNHLIIRGVRYRQRLSFASEVVSLIPLIQACWVSFIKVILLARWARAPKLES